MPQPPSDPPLTRSSRNWWQRIVPAGGAPQDEDPPLRAELFSAEQMARTASGSPPGTCSATARCPIALLARLAVNERVLAALGGSSRAADADRRDTPAAEWLLDNFYLIEEEIRTARRHLPRGYSRELPRLALDAANGSGAGLPRVYDLALQAIAHGDGQIGRGTLTRFVAAYQSVQPLLLGELWAIPIMLRLALIENLRRVAARVAVGARRARHRRRLGRRDARGRRESPSDLILVIADMARSAPPLTNAFVAEFARRLQGQGAALALPLTWIEQRLAESGPDDRAAGAARGAAAGREPGLGQQQHRQPAPARCDGLARVRRVAERRRADAARRSGRRLRARWTSARATAIGT